MTAIHGRFSRSQAIIENGELLYKFSLVHYYSSTGQRKNGCVLLFSPLCLSEGAEIDCEDKNGNTPLHIAARYGHELLISTLITNRADTAK